MTRDSWIWKMLFWGGAGAWALVEALIALSPSDASAIGLTPEILTRIRVLAVLVVGVGGKLGLSLLPKKEDGSTVNLSKIAPIALLCLTLPLLGGCHKNVTFESPKAKTAYTCEQILKPVGALQDTVIQTEAKGSLPTKDAILAMHALRIIEKVLVDVPKGWQTAAVTGAWNTGVAVLTLPKEMPATWQETVRVVWAKLKAKVPVLATNQYIAVAWALVDGMIGG
jgi:hypothetical protein